MKILTIIGSSGFLGRSFIDFACKEGLSKWRIKKIVSISRSKIYFEKSRKIEIKHLSRDISKLKKLPKTDYIIYAVNSENKNLNLKAIKNFSFLINKLSKKTKILFTSSGAIYGKIKNKEKYSTNKIFNEKIFKFYGALGYQVSIARLFTFIGERILNDRRYAISDFVQSGLSKKQIYVKSNSLIYRSYMHSYDMVNWLMTILLNSNINCPTYDVGSDEKIKIQKLAKIIGKIFNKPVKIKKINNKKVENYVPSIKKAKKELNLKINYKLRPSLYSIIKHKYAKKN